MQATRPVSYTHLRLLCGDVGFGKTEVALRAVMKCVLAGKQAAILVPTTVLARQHYLTAIQRFAGYPAVSYTHLVTAKRGDRTVKLTIGRKACTVDRAGSDRSFSTDAAPFIEGGRTYVPVRFAAQALGAAVGWDNNTQTVLIVDTEKMMQTEFPNQFQAITAMTQFQNSVAPVSYTHLERRHLRFHRSGRTQ